MPVSDVLGKDYGGLSHEGLRILSPEELATKLCKRPKKLESPVFGGLHRKDQFKSTVSRTEKKQERARAAVAKGSKKREARANQFRAKNMDVLFEAMDRLDEEQGTQNQFHQGANVENVDAEIEAKVAEAMAALNQFYQREADDEAAKAAAASRADDKALYDIINETISDLEESLSKDYAEFQSEVGEEANGEANGGVQEQQGGNNEGDNKEDAGPGVGGGNEGDAELGPETVDSDDDVSFATVPVANSGSWDF